MKVRLGTALLITAAAMFCNTIAEASAPTTCAERLTIRLTPDVPDPGDEGFLSSLLSNQVGYQLLLRSKTDSSKIVLDLIGPGPGYPCRDAIRTMRKDSRVLSIQVQHPH
jgi:hypothetical protein